MPFFRHFVVIAGGNNNNTTSSLLAAGSTAVSRHRADLPQVRRYVCIGIAAATAIDLLVAINKTAEFLTTDRAIAGHRVLVSYSAAVVLIDKSFNRQAPVPTLHPQGITCCAVGISGCAFRLRWKLSPPFKIVLLSGACRLSTKACKPSGAMVPGIRHGPTDAQLGVLYGGDRNESYCL